MKHKKLLLMLFLISLVGYGSSLFMESIAIYRGNEPGVLDGHTAFYYGYDWSGFESVISLLLTMVWSANVAYWTGVFLFAIGKYRLALVVSECGVFLAYPLLGIWIWGMWLEEIRLFSLSYGFFVWFGSIVL